ncbi:helix-turn-helix domain-containing protein [Olivibacter sitiensis]|uniref:helix-turn-helix domain-containing protein n=1 Tax=Olivibacter sitiensis TaxID=376470 RepID=UPI00042619C6|nr:AraC family transcriptional regulator [Olivibacter sitiensis]
MEKLKEDWIAKSEPILKNVGFNVYRVEAASKKAVIYSRKDFYKICLVTGKSIIEYADKGIKIQGTTLFFGTPHIPYSWETVSREKESYACLFTEEFLKTNNNSESLQQSPLFKFGGTPIFPLSDEQEAYISDIFKRMLSVYDTEYLFKNDLIRNYVNLIIHEALRLQPSENLVRHKNASERVASLFLELLERQFPVEDYNHPLSLKSPNDFARSLAVHVNHLNRSVKSITGKSTRSHISERVITEAKALLRHSDWNVAQIAYALGFEYPTYFNNYFKRLTGTTPTAFRK